MASDDLDAASGEVKTFKSLGLCDELVEAVGKLNWQNPTPIQVEAIPHALEGKDLIGLAQTGSGKTAAFALPILQALIDAPHAFFACVLAPTRELAIQISEQFEALGYEFGVKSAVLVGGVDMVQQTFMLAKRPHIIVATPGRLMDHVSNTKGFSLRTLKYLVLDEADRLLNEDFEKTLDDILKVIPRERRTYLFSATMTKKVKKLQRACLRNPVKIEVASKYSTVDTLKQQYRFLPAQHKNQKMTKKSSKKRAAKELDGLAIKEKVEIGHAEAADGILVDQDLNEPTMGEKHAILNIVPNNVVSENKEASSLHAQPPSADSVHILLKQALHADDRALLLECLYTQNEKVIAKSVSQLNPAGVLKLLQSLISLVESRGAILACALPWLRSLLLQHASGIVSQESSLSALNSLYQLIESRVSTFSTALQLSSVLDLLYTGVGDDLDDEDGTTGPVIYEDKDTDEEESEDAMDTDEEDKDNEDLDADLGGVSDFDGIEELDDLSD